MRLERSARRRCSVSSFCTAEVTFIETSRPATSYSRTMDASNSVSYLSSWISTESTPSRCLFVWDDLTWHDVTWYDTTRLDTTWHDMRRRDMIWHDMTQCLQWSSEVQNSLHCLIWCTDGFERLRVFADEEWTAEADTYLRTLAVCLCVSFGVEKVSEPEQCLSSEFAVQRNNMSAGTWWRRINLWASALQVFPTMLEETQILWFLRRELDLRIFVVCWRERNEVLKSLRDDYIIIFLYLCL